MKLAKKCNKCRTGEVVWTDNIIDTSGKHQLTGKCRKCGDTFKERIMEKNNAGKKKI